MKMKTAIGALLALAFAGKATAFELSSPNLKEGQSFALAQVSLRCGGGNVAPELHWQGEPAGTKSFALTMVDTTGRPPLGWTHWVLVDIPASVHTIALGGAVPGGARLIAGSGGAEGYFGPCPPEGTGTHRYVITLYALPGPTPELMPKADPPDLAPRFSGAANTKATLTGTWQR